MTTKLFFFCSPVRRNLFFQTLTHSLSNFSVLANSNAPSQNLFLHFVTTRLNISAADASKILKRKPSLGRLKSLDNAEQLVSMLNRFGITEHQIATMIRSQPSLLVSSVERLLEPKIQVLKDFGIEGQNLTKVLAWLPGILVRKLEVLRSRLELLRTVFPTQDLLIRAIRRNPRIILKSLQETLKTSIVFWEDFGFRGTELTMFLLVHPWVLMRTSLLPEQRDLIGKIGVHKESNMYKYVVSMVALSRFEVLEVRIHSLELCGLSPEQALQVVRAAPRILEVSEENIKKKMDLMLNHMELSADFLAKHPRLITRSLEKVMRPRFSVLQNMTAEKLNPSRLYTILEMTEAKFVAQIIQGHPEAATLWTVYKNAIANVSDR